MKQTEAVWIVEKKVHAAKCPYCGEQNTTDNHCSHFVFRDMDFRSIFHFGQVVNQRKW